ncbi:MAG: AAA family ATPase [Rhodoferax sp.]
MLNGHDRAIDALNYIDAGCDRESWHKAGRAAIAAGLTIEDIDRWSATGANYKGPRDVLAAFRTIKPEGGTGAGALFGMARDAGWTDGKTGPQRQPPTHSRPIEQPRKPAAGMSADEVWSRCDAATNSHGYVAAKGADDVPLKTLRVVPAGDSLRIAEQSMAGFLMVPAYTPDGEMQSVQFIPPNGGKKLNLPGASMAGASFIVGWTVPGCRIYLCEGIGQAWACWMATGGASVCCFGWGNVRRVAEAMRERDPSAQLVLVPDVGKELEAAKIAADVGAAVAAMPEGEANNFDANDLMKREGGDGLAILLEAATELPKPKPPMPEAEALLKPVSVFDVLSSPSEPPAFVWDGYLPRGQVSLLAAHGGTGKSTIALMLAVCTVLGRPLFGVATEQSNVLFVSLEDGVNIVRHRLASICKAWLIDPELLRGGLHIVDGTEHPELFSAETRGSGDTTASYLELRKIVQFEHIGLVLIDNASDAFGGDEIQRLQVRAFMRSLAVVARLTDCAVLLLAHVDKMTSRNKKAEGGEGYSGSTAWHNSARSRMFLTRGDNGLLTLEHQKSNLGRMREPLTLEWLDGSFPQVVADGGFGASPQQGRADDDRAAALLRLIAEFAGRGQYCSPALTSRNNVHALLKSEPAFQKLKLRLDDTKRVVTQCQRAKWIEPIDYRGPDRKPHQRWNLTNEGYAFAGLPVPTAPTCANYEDGTNGTKGSAPTAPTTLGGVGDRAHTEQGATETEISEKFFSGAKELCIPQNLLPRLPK